MSTCAVPANQPIYQALLDKAASYPADKPYQAKAYKKAAETVLSYGNNIYDRYWNWGTDVLVANIGTKIENFIYEFIEINHQLVKQTKPVEQPKPVEEPKPVEQPKPVEEPKPVKQAKYDWYKSYLDSLKSPVYTAENPRRSRRIANKPTPKYFDEEDLEDEIPEDSDEEYIDVDDDVVEAIESVCIKKGYTYSDNLITEFEAWFTTASKYDLEKYDFNTGNYIPRTKYDIANYWAMWTSKSLLEQKKQQKMAKTIANYCKKNNTEYQDVMVEKFTQWKADPANKKLITATYKYSSGCNCGSCDPTGTKMANTTEYSYERSPIYCIKLWFSTLKKTVVF
jgi:hypothetical protein